MALQILSAEALKFVQKFDYKCTKISPYICTCNLSFRKSYISIFCFEVRNKEALRQLFLSEGPIKSFLDQMSPIFIVNYINNKSDFKRFHTTLPNFLNENDSAYKKPR